MKLDFPSNYHAVKDLYWVSIGVGATPYLYPVFSHSHFEALMTAVTEHQKAGYPLPVGTCCYVDGPCHERACDCGKIRIIKYVIISTTSGASSTTAA